MRSAHISSCKKYRYLLGRGWENMFAAPGSVLFIGLNPSTADAFEDDPTIRRCIGFTDALGYKKFHMANLFAFRATCPYEMMLAAKPVGISNDEFILSMAKKAKIIIACWGNLGQHNGRANQVLELLKDFDIHALKINSDGSPGHPLYLRKDSKLKLFRRKVNTPPPRKSFSEIMEGVVI